MDTLEESRDREQCVTAALSEVPRKTMDTMSNASFFSKDSYRSRVKRVEERRLACHIGADAGLGIRNGISSLTAR